MPSPKSGNAGSAVAPANSAQAHEADTADPGQVEKVKAQQRETESGKYGSAQTKPYKPPQTREDKATKKSWIEIFLVDAQDHPVAGESYEIELPDASVKKGTLDEKGFARVDGIDPGTCKVTFPEMDGRSWAKA